MLHGRASPSVTNVLEQQSEPLQHREPRDAGMRDARVTDGNQEDGPIPTDGQVPLHLEGGITLSHPWPSLVPAL